MKRDTSTLLATLALLAPLSEGCSGDDDAAASANPDGGTGQDAGPPPLDPDAYAKFGATLGSGAVVAFDFSGKDYAGGNGVVCHVSETEAELRAASGASILEIDWHNFTGKSRNEEFTSAWVTLDLAFDVSSEAGVAQLGPGFYGSLCRSEFNPVGADALSGVLKCSGMTSTAGPSEVIEIAVLFRCPIVAP